MDKKNKLVNISKEKSVAVVFREIWNVANNLAQRDCNNIDVDDISKLRIVKGKRNDYVMTMVDMYVHRESYSLPDPNQGCRLED